MKRFSIIILALTLATALSACSSRNKDKTNNPTNTTGNTMPTIVTTKPHEDTIPGTSFLPDQDGMIGQTESTTETTQDISPSIPDTRTKQH